MKEEQKPVFIPAELYEKIEARVNSTEFDSVEEYVSFVLEEVIKEEDESVFSEEEEQEVKKRLRSLGYLD